MDKIYIVSVVGLLNCSLKIISTNHPILKRWVEKYTLILKTNNDKIISSDKISSSKSELFAIAMMIMG